MSVEFETRHLWTIQYSGLHICLIYVTWNLYSRQVSGFNIDICIYWNKIKLLKQVTYRNRLPTHSTWSQRICQILTKYFIILYFPWCVIYVLLCNLLYFGHVFSFFTFLPVCTIHNWGQYDWKIVFYPYVIPLQCCVLCLILSYSDHTCVVI